MGFWAPLVTGLGKMFTAKAVTAGAKTVLGAAAGGFLNSAFENKSQRDRYDFLASKGLTPQEIAGSGGSSASASGVGNVLGNQQAELTRIARQQAYDEKQRNLDRAIAIRAQDTGLRQSQISAGASIYSSDVAAATAANSLALQQDRFDQVEMPAALRQAVTEAPEWKRMEILSRMGVDNILGTRVAQMFGINPMDPSQVKAASIEEFLQIAQYIYGIQSNAFGEASGAGLAINQAFGGYKTLGDQGGGSGDRRDRR